MNVYVVFLLPLMTSILILVAVGLTLKMMQRSQERTNQQSNLLLNQSLKYLHVVQQSQQDLLNRLQSQDLPTFQSLTALRSPQVLVSDPYYSQADEAVAARLAQATGIGEVVYDEYTEFGDTMAELLDRES